MVTGKELLVRINSIGFKIMDGIVRGKPVVLFDGYCNLCCGFTSFVLTHDPSARILFAPLQGDTANSILHAMGYISPPADSVILVQDGAVFIRSTAVLRVFRLLGPPWSWLYPLVCILRPIRDFFYWSVARSRYSIFGRRKECRAPGSDERGRMLP
jgi:predicted DCC family thiol-disulfide oxidoreductase YuxK